jgi:aminodeoxychorismate lyase
VIAFLNGKFVREDRAVVSIHDRGFLYGDGLFESILVSKGQPFLWWEHWERLQRGAEFLGIRTPLSSGEMYRAALQLIQRNGMKEAVLRINLSRGSGPRGYSPKGADHPTLAVTLHPAPEVDHRKPRQWRLATSSLRVPANDAVSQFKTSNKLVQVLARAEAEAKGADEALILNTRGEVAEAATSNVFWLHRNVICTTPLATGALGGVTRAFIMEYLRSRYYSVAEKHIQRAALLKVDAVFLTMSSLGVVEVTHLDGVKLKRAALTKRLHQAFWRTVRAGC